MLQYSSIWALRKADLRLGGAGLVLHEARTYCGSGWVGESRVL